MKKLALFLALILCMVPVLSSCGVNSSAEKVAVAAVEAMFVDFDYEAYYETNYILNLDLLEDVMGGSDKYEGMKDEARSERETVKEQIKSLKNSANDYEDYDVKFDVRYVISYEKDSKYYDKCVQEFEYIGTDFQDLIEEVAIVGIAAERYATDDEDNETVSGNYFEITCYNIDGDWFIGNHY